jgi:hypothetical protein
MQKMQKQNKNNNPFPKLQWKRLDLKWISQNIK